MQESKEFNFSDFKNSLTEKDLIPLKIIMGVLNGGVLVFFLIALFVFSDGHTNEIPDDMDFQMANILLVALAVITMSTFFLSKIIPEKVLNPEGLVAKNLLNSAKENKLKLIALLSNYYIVKMALMEAPALFGVVILFLTSMSGLIHHYSIVWLSILPLVMMLAYTVTNFPNKVKVIELLRLKGF